MVFVLSFFFFLMKYYNECSMGNSLETFSVTTSVVNVCRFRRWFLLDYLDYNIHFILDV